MDSKSKLISIIIPAYNEEKNIPLIYAELKSVFLNLPKYQFEIIFINDGSVDGSWKEIQKLARTDAVVRGVSFSRNFGHQAAIEAGLKSAQGDAIIMMDGDLQHPPTLIPTLVERWENGFCIVNTKRKGTESESIFKRITSKLFYQILNKISETHLDPGSADFRLLDRRVVTELVKLTERDKFYRGLIAWVGFSSVAVEYFAGKRKNGHSAYTLRRMLTFARVGITSFSMLPMKMIIFLGLILFFIGGTLLSGMLYWKYCVDGTYFSGTAILASFIILNNGIMIILIGIISVYQMSMFKELKNRPNFIIEEKVGS